MHIFPNFRQASSIETLKKANKEQIYCRVGFSGEFNAVFEVNMSQIVTESDKNSKLSIFQFLRIFSQIFDRLRELESGKGPTRKYLVVR